MTRNKSDDTLVWEDIPPRQDSRNLWHTKTQEILMSNPGNSARIKKYNTNSSALTSAVNLRKRWPSEFVIVTRGNAIYATYYNEEMDNF